VKLLILGGTRFLVRVTPGIEADTHEAVKTAHHGSKFGLPPDDAIEALRRLPAAEGLHVHVGSQLQHFGASLMTVDWVAGFAARARAELGWLPKIVDLGGGLGVRHVPEEPAFTIEEFVGGLVREVGRAWQLQGLPPVGLILEPLPHGDDPTLGDGDAVALDERALDVARDDQADILDQSLHAAPRR